MLKKLHLSNDSDEPIHWIGISITVADLAGQAPGGLDILVPHPPNLRLTLIFEGVFNAFKVQVYRE